MVRFPSNLLALSNMSVEGVQPYLFYFHVEPVSYSCYRVGLSPDPAQNAPLYPMQYEMHPKLVGFFLENICTALSIKL